MKEGIESFSGRELLKSLESEGKYLFHGSPIKNIKRFEPRQAQSIKDGTSNMADDGKPAIAASPFIDIAIFRALFNKVNIKNNYTSSFSYKNGNLFFSTNQNSLEQAKKSNGYVYVFNKEYFQEYSPMEWRSERLIEPIKMVEVDVDDLLDLVKIQIKNV